jgi:DNA-binding response OmpR family regulator
MAAKYCTELSGTTKKLFNLRNACGIVNLMAETTKKVMLVEDDRFLSSLIKARLEKDGLMVVQAFDGDDAIKNLPDAHPDLVILDLIMPKTNGFEVLKAISLMPGLERTPVVIVSNLAQDSDIEKARQLGAKEYFVKVKISIDDLIGKIETLVQQPS